MVRFHVIEFITVLTEKTGVAGDEIGGGILAGTMQIRKTRAIGINANTVICLQNLHFDFC